MREFFRGCLDTLTLICIMVLVMPVQVAAVIMFNVADILLRLLVSISGSSAYLADLGLSQQKQNKQ